MTRGLSEDLDLQRDDDTDDVRWALQTAAVQLNRGGIADAVTWIQRAADAAEKAGNEWRALELRARARGLQAAPVSSGRARHSSIPVEVVVEEVEIDELLEEEDLPTNPPPPPFGHGAVPQTAVGRIAPVAPAVPFERIPANPFFASAAAAQFVAGQPQFGAPPPPYQAPPPPFPGAAAQFAGAPQFTAGQPPFAGAPQAGMHPAQPAPNFGPAVQVPFVPVSSSSAPPPSARGDMAGTSSLPPQQGLKGRLPRSRVSPIPLSAPPPKPGSLAQKTRIAFPAAGRLRQPSAPSLGYALSSSQPPPLPSDAFAASAQPRVRLDEVPMRRPMASAPDLEVNEVDLDDVGIDLSSLPPESLNFSNRQDSDRTSFNDRLSSAEVDTIHAEAVIAQLDSTLGNRFSEQPSSQDLSHLFDEEEVEEDDASEDRMSELTLDAGEFDAVEMVPAAGRTGFESAPLGSGAPSTPPPAFAGRESDVPVPSAPAWLTPSSSNYRSSSAPYSAGGSNGPPSAPLSGNLLGAPPSSRVPPSVPPPSVPPPSVPPPSVPPPASVRTGMHESQRPGISTESLPAVPFPPSPSSVRPLTVPPPPGATPVPSQPAARSSSPAAGSSRPPPAPQRSQSSKPPAPTARPSLPYSDSPPSARRKSILDFAQALTASTPPPAKPVHPSAPPDAVEPPVSSVPQSASMLPTLAPQADRESHTSLEPPAFSTPTSARVDGLELGEARGFEDLPETVQLTLAKTVRIETLSEGEEVAFFGAAIVTFGAVDILPAISDEAGSVAHQGEVVFTLGTLPDSMPLRVVAKLEGSRVAVWDRDTFNAAIAECPWVHDDLHQIADRFLACCGATLGALGERLDDALRGSVFSRLEVRVFHPGEQILKAGEAVPKLFVVGGGRIDVVDKSGQSAGELGPGDFVFPSSILSASPAPYMARAGSAGALVLQAPRSVAHELMMSVPPLLEILAS